jgi:hypothetical protein
VRLLGRDARNFWPLWIIVLAGVILRMTDIGRVPGLFGDEAWYGVQTQRLLSGTRAELRTPTGNPIGLIQLSSLTLLHSLFERSALILRVPALLTSLAAMGLTYVVGRRFFGATAAMAGIVLMAAMPINVAYARLGWDPSHAALLVLAATYATLNSRRLLGALFFALALANHPAAVFVAPFLSLAYLGFELDRETSRSALAKTFIFTAMLLLAVLLSFSISPRAETFLDSSAMVSRLFDPTQWRDFALGYVRLLSGDTIYIFIAGRGFGDLRPWIDAAVGLVILVVFLIGIFLAKHDRRLGGMVFGWMSSVLFLFIVAGPLAVRPVFERFAFPTVAISLVTVGVVVGKLLPSLRQKTFFQASLAVVASPLLIGFCVYYLGPLLLGQNRPNTVYWVGVPELNIRAADRIRSINGRTHATILAEDWWIYWPVVYSLADPWIEGVDAPAATRLDKMPVGRSYWISYRHSHLDQLLAHHAAFKAVGTVETKDQAEGLNVWLREMPARKSAPVIGAPLNEARSIAVLR